MWHDDKIELLVRTGGGHDDDFNPVKADENWIDLGACKIHGNQAARTIPSADGKDDVYTYQVVLTSILSVIPKLGTVFVLRKRMGLSRMSK